MRKREFAVQPVVCLRHWAPRVALAAGIAFAQAPAFGQSGSSYPYQQQAPSRGFFGFLFGPAGPELRSVPPRNPYDGFGEDGNERTYDYDFPRPRAATYRTMCVRLCDGYYWPISFSATRNRFAADSRQCESSCVMPAKLYVYRNPGGDIEQMRDLSGAPYTALPSAFRYRKEYVADCRCKPDPWSEEARAEYAQRAEEKPAPAALEAASLDAATSDETQREAGTPSLQSAPPARTRTWSNVPAPRYRYEPQVRHYDTQPGGWFPFPLPWR